MHVTFVIQEVTRRSQIKRTKITLEPVYMSTIFSSQDAIFFSNDTMAYRLFQSFLI